MIDYQKLITSHNDIKSDDRVFFPIRRSNSLEKNCRNQYE